MPVPVLTLAHDFESSRVVSSYIGLRFPELEVNGTGEWVSQSVIVT